MIKKFIPFLLAMVILACNNNRSSGEEDKDTIEEVEEPYVDPVKQEIDLAFPEAYQFFSAQDSSFNAMKFHQMSSRIMNSAGLKISDAITPYYPLFIYNADSSYAIDLYSYNVILRKRNGKITTNHAGPDTEVALIDLKNKTRKRIYFGGSSSVILDAKWINNDELFLLTGEIISPSKFQPQILQYKLSDNKANEFDYNDTLQLRISDYSDKRLEKL
jgi:hypothetical protein